MLDGRQRHDWSIAAAVMSVVASTARDPKAIPSAQISRTGPIPQPARPVRVGRVGPQRRFDRRMPEVARDSCMKSLTTRHCLHRCPDPAGARARVVHGPWIGDIVKVKRPTRSTDHRPAVDANLSEAEVEYQNWFNLTQTEEPARKRRATSKAGEIRGLLGQLTLGPRHRWPDRRRACLCLRPGAPALTGIVGLFIGSGRLPLRGERKRLSTRVWRRQRSRRYRRLMAAAFGAGKWCVITMRIKDMFFDRHVVMAAVDNAKRKVLSRPGVHPYGGQDEHP